MKYNEIMERIQVDENMRTRVLEEVAEATKKADGTDKITDLRGRLPLKRVLPVVAAACLLLIIGSAAVSGVFSGKGDSAGASQSAAATVESADEVAAEEAAPESAENEAPAEAFASEADEPVAEEAAAEDGAAGLTASAAGDTEDSASDSKSADASAAEENGTSEAAAEDTAVTTETTEEAAESEEAAAEAAAEEIQPEAASDSADGTAEAESQSSEGTADAGVSSSDATGTATEAETLTHLSELAGFEVRELTDLPFDVASVSYLYIAGHGAQIVYAGENGDEVVYTMSPEALPAVDPTSYEDIMVIHNDGREIVLYGADHLYSLARWEADGYSFTAEMTPARDQSDWREIKGM